jgi:hypothetical protein
MWEKSYPNYITTFFLGLMSSQILAPEQSHRIKTFTTNQLIEKLRDCFELFPKQIHVLFNIDSLKKSVIDVNYIKPLLYVFELGNSKKLISAKDMNERLEHEIVYLNLRKGIESKIHQLNHQFFSINIMIDKQRHEEFEYYPTNLSYIVDKFLIGKINAGDEELIDVSEFRL